VTRIDSSNGVAFFKALKSGHGYGSERE